MGLHLFPVLRVRKELPLLSVTIEEGGKKFPVSLSEPIKNKITDYLRDGKSYNCFTCFQFVDFINNFYSSAKPRFRVEKYHFQERNISEIRPGDAVVLARAGELIHAALYLDRDCYLWHCGKRCLRVSTLDQMRRVYPSDLLKIAQ